MKNKFRFVIISLAVLMPSISYALLDKTRTVFQDAETIVTTIVLPLVFTLALLVFFWGIVKYIKSEGSGKEEGRQIMVWGIVALFVMSSVWGLVRFFRTEIGVQEDAFMKLPTIQK